MRSVCVFCGAREGARPSYAEAARRLGSVLAARGTRLVYGGGRVGLMGTLADAVLDAGGEVVGVIPESLVTKELAHGGLSELRVVGSMHERKQLMADLSEGFVALPGGFGTLEELSEVLSWAQLGLHEKPCGLLDVDGFFGPLVDLYDRCVEEGFLSPKHRKLVLEEGDPESLLKAMERYVPPETPRWVGPREA